MERTSDLGIDCPICNKPDGCLVAEDLSCCICSRIETGSIKKVGKGPFQGGWFHILKPGTFEPKPVKEKQVPKIDWNERHKTYVREGVLNNFRMNQFAASMNVSTRDLFEYQCGLDKSTLMIPMKNHEGRIVGFQRRFLNGDKRHKTHSSIGLFLPIVRLPVPNYIICEGFSDTVTAHSLLFPLGYTAIGRVNCSSSIDLIERLIQSTGAKTIRIISDNDAVGIDGAQNLANGLLSFFTDIKIVIPPYKDLREWKRKGLNAAFLLQSFLHSPFIT